MASQQENVLFDLINDELWADAMARVKTEEGREELRRKTEYGRLPLHRACVCGAPLELVKAMVEEYPEAVEVTDSDRSLPLHYACIGDDVYPQVVRLILKKYPEGAKKATIIDGSLPLHWAARCSAPLEVLGMLIDAHPEGAATRDNFGQLPLHWLATYASPNDKEDVEKVELLMRPLLKNEEACKAANGHSRMLPLHIAAKFGLSMDILRALLDTYCDAAKEKCELGDELLCALDLLERRRNNCITTPCESKSDESAASPNHAQGEATTATPTAEGGGTELRADVPVTVVKRSSQGRMPRPTKEASEGGHGAVGGVGVGAGDAGGGPTTPSSPVEAGSGDHSRPSQSDRATTTGFGTDLPSPSHLSRSANLDGGEASINDRKPPGKSMVPYRIQHAQLQLHMQAQQHQLYQPDQRHTAARGARPADHDGDGAKEAPMQNKGHHNRSYRHDTDIEIAYSSAAVAGAAARVMKHDAGSAGSVKRRRIVQFLSEGRPANQADGATNRQQQPTKLVQKYSEPEFNQKSDLLFAYNPDILPYRKDESRLKRFVDQISSEARERNLSEPSRRVWIWMCTFTNGDDPGDSYVSEINTILGRLGDRKLVEWLASFETPGVRQIREIAASTFATTINAHFLFAGRFEISSGPHLHKSATSVVLKGRDFGDLSDTDEWLSDGSNRNKSSRVVVKFMRNPYQFARELDSRKSKSATGCPNKLDRPFLVPSTTVFFTPSISELDRQYIQDINRSVFGDELNVLDYGYGLVMRRGDRTLDDIGRNEKPSLNKVRVMMEQVANAMDKLHGQDTIHGDIKPENIVRLNGHMALIDLDASCRTKCHVDYGSVNDFVGEKFSSGYLPPEMIAELKDNEAICTFHKYFEDATVEVKNKVGIDRSDSDVRYVVKTFSSSKNASDLPYDRIDASASIDVWSFGVVLFKLCSGEDLFQIDQNGDLVREEDYRRLCKWNKESAKARISKKITDGLARDLLLRLLIPRCREGEEDDGRIDNMSDVLRHDFFRPHPAMKGIQS